MTFPIQRTILRIKKYADGKVDITFDLDPKTADQYIIRRRKRKCF